MDPSSHEDWMANYSQELHNNPECLLKKQLTAPERGRGPMTRKAVYDEINHDEMMKVKVG